jgi:hypothetical protein
MSPRTWGVPTRGILAILDRAPSVATASTTPGLPDSALPLRQGAGFAVMTGCRLSDSAMVFLIQNTQNRDAEAVQVDESAAGIVRH